MTPTSRTLAECRKRGWLADVTERWIAIPGHPAGGQRRDLFGFVDILAITQDGVLAIQATSGTNVAARVTKIRDECSEALEAILGASVRVQVWGWKKYAKPVESKYWRVRIVEIESEVTG